MHSLYWQSVEEVIYGDIDTMIDFFESVYSGGKALLEPGKFLNPAVPLQKIPQNIDGDPRWESHSYDVFLSNLAGLMEGAATKDVHSLYWQSVEEVIYGDGQELDLKGLTGEAGFCQIAQFIDKFLFILHDQRRIIHVINGRAASDYLSTALYQVYRQFYQINPANNPDFFSMPPRQFQTGLADADMKCSQAELADFILHDQRRIIHVINGLHSLYFSFRLS